LAADFDVQAFAKLSISDEPTAIDKIQQEEARLATVRSRADLSFVVICVLFPSSILRLASILAAQT
jgi:hypothetical protein